MRRCYARWPRIWGWRGSIRSTASLGPSGKARGRGLWTTTRAHGAATATRWSAGASGADLVSGRAAPEASWSHDAGRSADDRRHATTRRSRPAARPRSAGVLRALDGRFVEPGPSGAPTRGRPDVLPTGRNFYSRRHAHRADAGRLATGLDVRSLLIERATGRITAPGRAAWRSPPGARRTCAPAATTSRRRWR